MSEETKRYQCRHIFTDGHRCGSPCLRREEFCYYHHTTRRPIQNPRERRSRQTQFDIPLPEDRSAIQCSIGEVLRRIARNEIDSKRAGLLLYGLQIASLNLPRTAEPKRDSDPVEEVTAHPQLGTLAPRAEVAHQERPLSAVAALLKRISDDEATLDESTEAESAATPSAPAILPAIQAHHDTLTTTLLFDIGPGRVTTPVIAANGLLTHLNFTHLTSAATTPRLTEPTPGQWFPLPPPTRS